jgi:enoyl-CoA hydratase/carnithine racemase
LSSTIWWASGSGTGTAHASPQSRMHVQQAIAALVPKLRNLRQPVIAAVNGPASGSGAALSEFLQTKSITGASPPADAAAPARSGR